jgi:hypothetical protein
MASAAWQLHAQAFSQRPESEACRRAPRRRRLLQPRRPVSILGLPRFVCFRRVARRARWRFRARRSWRRFADDIIGHVWDAVVNTVDKRNVGSRAAPHVRTPHCLDSAVRGAGDAQGAGTGVGLRPAPAVADVADEPPRNGRLLPVKRAGACTAGVRGSNPLSSTK